MNNIRNEPENTDFFNDNKFQNTSPKIFDENILRKNVFTKENQPKTHKQNINCKYYCCFSIKDRKNDLSTNELISFYELKTICNVLYDPLEESHIKQLEKLTFLLFENNEIKDWKSFGFQNSIPETDFRGGGLISLKNIIFFIENCNPEIIKIIKETPEFLFAIISINITFFLKKYFHLADFLIYEKNIKEICGRNELKKVFKKFIHEKNEEKNFGMFHNIILENCFKKWILFKNKGNKENLILHLQNFLEKYLEYFKKCFIDRHIQDFKMLIRSLDLNDFKYNFKSI